MPAELRFPIRPRVLSITQPWQWEKAFSVVGEHGAFLGQQDGLSRRGCGRRKSSASFVLMAMREIPALAFIAAVMALYPLIYYVVQYIPRYRYPILWLSLLGAGYALSEWTAAARERLLRRRGDFLG
ncbi:MAG TPA: hypothetical protein VN893_04000 [Bryobacteraceae bacterium]|nr:hypothetical protein [Bryobacteraceae bacterium]